jgi:hypothetical protein
LNSASHLCGRCSTTWASPSALISWMIISSQKNGNGIEMEGKRVDEWTFFFLQCWGLNSGPTPWATPPALFLWFFFFWNRVLQTICLGWLQTTIPLISASWVARITGVSHHTGAQLRAPLF